MTTGAIPIAYPVDSFERELHGEISQFWIVDSHEHIPPESHRLALQVDAVSLFENYPKFNLLGAGMTQAAFKMMTDRERPLDERWEILNSYLPLIRQCSSVRTTLLAVRELYGFDDVTSSNYVDLTESMRAANKPGIYRRIYRDHCRIDIVLNQVYHHIWDGVPARDNFCVPQMWIPQFSVAYGAARPLNFIESDLGRSVSSYGSYLEAIAELLSVYRDRGVLGVKLDKYTIQSHPMDRDAAPLFDRVLLSRGGTPPQGTPYSMLPSLTNLSPTEWTTLRDSIAHHIIRACGELGLVVIQHCGYRGVWQEYRVANPTDLVPVFMEYPQVRFELYHAGIPWVRETGILGAAFPNVWLNLCWGHSLSSQMCRSALNEWLDLVPANKIIAFGGDTAVWSEWTVGDLIQARENVAAVLASRVRQGLLGEREAVELARLMFCDNPRKLYNLRQEQPGNRVYE